MTNGLVISPRRRRPLMGATQEAGPSESGPDQGSITAFVALMLVAIFALVGLVVDGGSELSAHQSAVDEAEQAARAGAGALSVGALRSGSLQIDTPQAVMAAEQFTLEAGHPGTATVSAGTVTVAVHYRIRTQILGIIGLSSLPVSASASAVNVQGVAVGSS
jgi:hypothetical protein